MADGKRKVLIDLGCGLNKAPGYIGMDNRFGSHADIIAQLPDIPFKKNSVDGFRARHVLEHFFSEDVFDILIEAARCLKIGGEFQVIVPHFSSPGAFKLDHKSFWSIGTTNTLIINGLHDETLGSCYELVSRRVFWMRREYRGRFPALVRFMNRMINKNPSNMERMASWFGGIYEMEFVLRKVQ